MLDRSTPQVRRVRYRRAAIDFYERAKAVYEDEDVTTEKKT